VIRHRAGTSRDARIVFGFWSGARDLNPGPHGPEIYAVSSTGTGFAGFELVWERRTIPIGPFGAITAAALLHELLHRMSTPVDAVHNADEEGALWSPQSDAKMRAAGSASRVSL
jgi:hypothetical protein